MPARLAVCRSAACWLASSSGQRRCLYKGALSQARGLRIPRSHGSSAKLWSPAANFHMLSGTSQEREGAGAWKVCGISAEIRGSLR
jgi:hypothetical protein